MNITVVRSLFLAAGMALGLQAQAAGPKDLFADSPYFAPSSAEPRAVDAEGFVTRWLVLEPIDVPNRSNTVFTDTYLRNIFDTYLQQVMNGPVPAPGLKVKVGNQTLRWHALDSKLFNVKLFRFASTLSDKVYGVLFWVFTEIDCPETLTDVRLSVGSNSASMWWIDGKTELLLSGDRRMVRDDAMSHRLTLTKGRHSICGAVINGPGMSDFCLRFVDEAGKPITDITAVSLAGR